VKKSDVVWISELLDVYGMLSGQEYKTILADGLDHVRLVEDGEAATFFCEGGGRHVTIEAQLEVAVEMIEFFKKYRPLSYAISILEKISK
jgi:hypothetical protein